MEPSNRELVCASCGRRFDFSDGEQGDTSSARQPWHCKSCRRRRKAQRNHSRERSRTGNGRRNEHRLRSANRQRPADQLPSPDDPNGYRAPAFRYETDSPHVIDYSGLPKDEDDTQHPSPVRNRDDDIDRFGLRTDVWAPSRSQRGTRGGNGRRFDRRGTDPDAYRSPAFRDLDPVLARAPVKAGNRRRGHGARWPRHQTTCADCGVQTAVSFQPGPDRPAYCKSCYQARKANGTVTVPRGEEPTRPQATNPDPSGAPAPASVTE